MVASIRLRLLSHRTNGIIGIALETWLRYTVCYSAAELLLYACGYSTTDLRSNGYPAADPAG